MSKNILTAKELKERIASNDNRCTRQPYLLLLRERKTMVVDGNVSGDKRWVEHGSGDYHTADTKEELIETIKEWHDDDEEFEEEKWHIEPYYEDEYYDTVNVFLTDKGYEDHMKINGHNYRRGQYDTYGIHAFRNEEIRSLYALIDSHIDLESVVKSQGELIKSLKEQLAESTEEVRSL